MWFMFSKECTLFPPSFLVESWSRGSTSLRDGPRPKSGPMDLDERVCPYFNTRSTDNTTVAERTIW